MRGVGAVGRQARGVADTAALPEYPYRDDALLLWDALDAYIGENVSLAYPTDESVQQDSELASFFRDLLHGLGEKAGVLPASLDTREALCKLLVEFCFTVSAQHAAVNFTQYEFYGYVPYRPAVLTQSPPTSKGTTSEESYVAMLPNRDQTQTLVGIGKVLTSTASDEQYLGQIKQTWLYEAAPLKALEKFEGRLKEIEKEIDARNQVRSQEMKYIHMKPSRVPSSIAI
ncbi:hypothetical protein CYMTET_33444 [Cymbomonas tetramitiformis]|uniref:Lipoxygenase domain-containing protein n=1 Tax=Cymbomonas tetramitiformis TaxID=36881 RepID=A0AAE0FD44_9CHLO|nr:hypothetical protein CYMTET_33444 [Cymbomonas tetramitiformis]